MSPRPWLRLLVMAAALATAGQTLQAQQPPENAAPLPERSLHHQKLGLPQGLPTSPDDLLNQRLDQAQKHLQAHQLAQKILQNPELRNRLFESLKNQGFFQPGANRLGLQAERLREAIQPLLESGELQPGENGQELPREQLEAIGKRFQQSLQPQVPEGESPLPSEPVPGESAPPGGSGSPDSGTPEPGPPAPGSGRGPNELARRFLERLGDRLEDVDPALAQSPALQRALRQLQEGRETDGDWSWPQLGGVSDRFGERLAEWSRGSNWERLRFDVRWPRAIRPPAISAPNWGRRWLPRLPSFGRPSAPSFRTPSTSPASAGTALLWLLVVIVGGVVLWKLLTLRRLAQRGTGRDWRLGPWPVDPARVATREDLVRAFEYLSLLRLGPAARHQNHRQLAVGLGGEELLGDPHRRQAAARLADLYEQARYAPPAEDLPEDDVAAARHDLCFLAGVSAA